MSSILPTLSLLLLLGLLFACTNNSIRGDIYPDIPELPDSRSDALQLQHLPGIISIQYSPDGNIHVFGYLPNDTAKGAKRVLHLMIHNQHFEQLSTHPITSKHVVFIDPQSNVYTSNQQGGILRFSYPDYQDGYLLPPHPATATLEALLAQELFQQGPRKDEYAQLKKEGKEDIIEQNNKEVETKMMACYREQIDLSAIDYGIKYSNYYTLFMKNGAVCTIKLYQRKTGQASLSRFLKKQRTITLYNNFGRDDKGISIANMMLIEQGSALQRQLRQIDFAVTEKKSTWENWPNTGYTKGYYYHELTLGSAKVEFKRHVTTSHRNDLYLVGKEDAPFCFLAGDGWFLARPK